MNEIIFRHKIGDQVFSEKKIQCLFYFHKDGSLFRSQKFASCLPLGNFTNILLWKSLLIYNERLNGFDQIIPISRLKISDALVQVLQKNGVKRLDIEEEKVSQTRKYNYQKIFYYLGGCVGIESVPLAKQLNLSPFVLSDMDVIEQEEFCINTDEMTIVSLAYQSLFESKLTYFEKNPLYFLPKHLHADQLND
ncbi:hypothetical protein MJH12_09940, partial [bacterium]|nr:hypothetical protein [bacterium]